MQIWLDLDQVFADFYTEANTLMGQDIFKCTSAHLWEELGKVPHLFRHLEVLPRSLEVYDVVKHLNPRILTALPRPTGLLYTARNDKVDWVAQHISSTIEVHTVVGKEYKRLYAKSGDILVDDNEANIRDWIEAGGVGLLHYDVDVTVNNLRKLTQ